MRVAMIKIGARISNKDLSKMSSTLSEVLATKKLLLDSGFDLDIYSKNPNNEDGIFDLECYWDLVNDRDYSALVVVNGSMPMYGGIDGCDDIYNHKIIASFSGPVVYMLFDPYLGLKDMSANISKKELYKEHTDSIKQERDDIIYITQCRNTSKINELGQKSITYFPLEQFPLFMRNIYKRPDSTIPENRNIDLAYCGSFRGGRRQKDMIEYFFNRNIRTEMTGNIKIAQFNQRWVEGKTPPVFNKPLKQMDLSKYMHNTLASVVIADPLYIDYYDIAQRAYEHLIYGVVNFIDLKVDPEKSFYESPFMKDFMYVRDGKELEHKINMLKQDENLLRQVRTHQQMIIDNFDYKEYVDKFKDMFTKLIKGEM